MFNPTEVVIDAFEAHLRNAYVSTYTTLEPGYPGIISYVSRMALEINCSIFVKNGRSQAGLGLGGEGFCSFTIASPTGEGMTGPRSFSRWRRCTLVGAFRIV